MKTISILIISIFGNILLCRAQRNDDKDPRALYIVEYKSQEIRSNHLLVDPQDIKNVEMHSKNERFPRVSSMEEDEALIITLKPNLNIKFLTLQQLFDTYNIAEQYRKLPIRIDNQEIRFKPQTIIAASDAVASITVKDGYIDIIEKTKGRPYAGH